MILTPSAINNVAEVKERATLFKKTLQQTLFEHTRIHGSHCIL
jgi:hypothetical protein